MANRVSRTRSLIVAATAVARLELYRRGRRGMTAITLFVRNIELLRQCARNHGYALAVHGTLLRDVDLIAVPWHGKASPRRALLDAIVGILKAVYGKRKVSATTRGTRKPLGRIAYSIHCGGSYFDLSITPR